MPIVTKEIQEKLSPREVLGLLMDGNRRFTDNSREEHDLSHLVRKTADGQFPMAIVLSCIDSRSPAELIFDQALGNIFSVRIAGNVLNDDIIGSMEFACAIAGAKLIYILGHTRCGAVNGAVQKVALGHLSGLLEKLHPGIEKTRSATGAAARSESGFLEEVARQNVLHQLEQVLHRSEILRNLHEEKKIGFAGGLYDVGTGKVEALKALLP